MKRLGFLLAMVFVVGGSPLSEQSYWPDFYAGEFAGSRTIPPPKIPTSEPTAPPHPTRLPDTRGTEQSPLMVRVIAEPKQGPVDWSLSDKIAAVAILVGFLQFVVLICTVIVMRRSSERQLRAYVGPTFDHTHPDVRGFPEIVMGFTNFGQTPAYDVTCLLGIELKEFPLRSALQPLAAERQAGAVLHPGSVHTIAGKSSRAVTSDEISQIQSGSKAVYFYGEIAYKDAFNVRRVTRFRWYMCGPEGFRLRRLEFHEDGNDAD